MSAAPLPHHGAAGRGPAVVLVHAGICDGGMWDPQWRSWVGPASADVRAQVRAMQLRAFEHQPGVSNDPEEALVPAGGLDHPDILAIADRLEHTLPNASAARIPGAARLPSLERPAAFDALVAPFLAAT